MSVFTEFLRDQPAKEAAEAARNKAVVDEWRRAIETLFRQIRIWLAASDPDGLITISQKDDYEVREPDLGRYCVPRLDLRAFGKWIGIIPKARHTVAGATPPQKAASERATGRVDITDETRRYVLYRFPQEGGATCG